MSTKTIRWTRTFIIALEVSETLPVGTDKYIVESRLREQANKGIRERSEGYLTEASPLKNNCPHPREHTESSGPNGCFMHCKICGERWND
jgi:hypothetical protein